MRNTNSTALPGWYVEFQAALLRQAPRPGEIDQVTAERLTNNQKGLKKKLAGCLLPPPSITAGLFLPKDGEKTKQIFEADMEKMLKNNSQFLTDTFASWYDEGKAKMAKQSVEIILPQDIDWETRKDDKDGSKFGEYTINPETISIDWENIPPEKIKALDFAEFVGRPRWELAKYLSENYADKYHIPGIEYWKYLYENQDKVPQELKDGNYYYFFGSILRGQDGFWRVPNSDWRGSQWGRRAYWLEDDWYSGHRVLLLEK